MDRVALEDVVKTFQIGDETFIKIKTSENSASSLRYGEVTQYVKGLNIKNIDFSAVKRAYKKCRGKSVCIGGAAGQTSAKPLYTIDISRDAMTCCITISQAGANQTEPDAGDIIAAIKAQNIVFGLKENNIKDVLKKRVFGKQIIAAEGVYPEAGKDARVKLISGLYGDIRAYRPECASVENFKKSTFINPVKENDNIAGKVKEEPGKEGRTIYGEEIKTISGVPLECTGANIFMSEEKVFANVDGHAIRTGAAKVRVEPLLTLKNATNREIVHDGSVKILGDVESCPIIEASGDIEIHGTVNNTKIKAGRNIVIHGNLFTKHDKAIFAGNDFLGQNVSNAAITAENIIITATSFNSILTAFRTIQNTSPEGKIVGGRSCAGMAFFASALGSSTNIPTEISIATKEFFSKHRKNILGYYTRKIRELNSHLALLEKKSEEIGVLKRGLLKDRESVYDKMAEEFKACMEKDEFKINKLQDKITQLKSHDIDAIQGEVLADKIFPNTSISLGEKKMTLKETLSNIRIQIKEGNIVSQTFHRNSVKW